MLTAVPTAFCREDIASATKADGVDWLVPALGAIAGVGSMIDASCRLQKLKTPLVRDVRVACISVRNAAHALLLQIMII